jgi:hypothetical protein
VAVMFNFKVTFSNGASIKLMNLADDTTLDMLRAVIFEKSEIPPEEQHGTLPTGLRSSMLRGEF